MTRKQVKQKARAKKLKRSANIKRNNIKYMKKSKLLRTMKHLRKLELQKLAQEAVKEQNETK